MKQVWAILFKGLATILPIAITLYAIYWLSVSSELLLGNMLKFFLPEEYYWTGMGLIVGVGLVFLIGVLVNNRIGEAFLRLGERLIARVPVAKTIYSGVRDLMNFFSSDSTEKSLSRVVLVTLAPDVRVMGFVTQETVTQLGRGEPSTGLVSVYVPVSYQIGGYTLYVASDRLEALDIPVEKAMRMTLTAGMSGH
ncbi:MAG: DUF502 domain-containing protein [Gammaproteobacteria bacterium]|nr:MAG: DUF502 domain-containing protein [Gammaproteobacteria bacterium]